VVEDQYIHLTGAGSNLIVSVETAIPFSDMSGVDSEWLIFRAGVKY